MCVCVYIYILDYCNESVILTGLPCLEPIMMPLAKHDPDIGCRGGTEASFRHFCCTDICEWVICLR
jgi:hypothetical protein